MTSSDSTVPWDITEITTVIQLVNTVNDQHKYLKEFIQIDNPSTEYSGTRALSTIAPAVGEFESTIMAEKTLI